MLIRFSKWFVVLTLAISLGAHWAFLQSVAWMGMIVTYSRDASFAEAVIKTFDGKHPCGLCDAIQKSCNEEKKQDQQAKTGSKLDPGLAWETVAFIFIRDTERISAVEVFPASRSDEPPKPRPRNAAFCNLV